MNFNDTVKGVFHNKLYQYTTELTGVLNENYCVQENLKTDNIISNNDEVIEK